MSFPSFLRVATNPEVIRRRLNATTWEKAITLDAVGVHYVEALSRALKFSFNFTTPSDEEKGRQLENGTWTGFIGMIQRKEVDLVVGGLGVTEERQTVLEFSYPIVSIQVTFATRKPVYASSLTTFLKPFTWEVWASTLACSILMTFVFSALLSRRYPIRKLILYICSTILHESVELRLKKPRDYIMVICWITAMMFIGYSYTAVLLSFMTFPTLEGVRSIPELGAAVSKGRYYCTTFPGTFMGHLFAHSSDPNIKIIGESLDKSTPITDIDEALSDRSSSKIPAVVYARYSFAPLAIKYFISNDVFLIAMPSVAAPKNFCCMEQINRAVGYIWASGMYIKWANHFTFEKSLYYLFQPREEEQKSERPLSVDDFMLIFFVLIAGLTLSTVVFAVELIVGTPGHAILEKNRMIPKKMMNAQK